MQNSHTLTPWPIIGHDTVVQFLRQLTAEGRDGLRHAYLLLGARQIGKTTVGKVFSQALFCTGEMAQPCGQCRSCRLVKHDNHPDLRLIQPVDKNGVVDRLGGTLRVEQATEIIHDVILRPMEGRYKIFLIQDLHTANVAFANKLLKTLEEPPAHAIFILTALERDRLLPTIVSRCQPIELRPVAPPVIAAALQEGRKISETEADLLSRLARGRVGWAIQQLESGPEQASRQSQLEMLWKLLDAEPVERLTIAEKMAAATNSQQIFELLETWTIWWRDVFLVQSHSDSACCNIDYAQELRHQAGSIPAEVVRQHLHTLHRIEGYLHHTINTRLALEVLFLRLPSRFI